MDNAKSQEKLVVSSGCVVCIDQFMLANQQLLDLLDDGVEQAEVLSRYGGGVFEFPSGEYAVFRDPKMQIIAIAKDGNQACTDDDGLGAVIEAFGPSAQSHGYVQVDTRCMVLCDASLLSNREILGEFAKLREAGEDKQGRDLLRKQGAAVRYGFNKWGDTLSLFARSEPDALAALWQE